MHTNKNSNKQHECALLPSVCFFFWREYDEDAIEGEWMKSSSTHFTAIEAASAADTPSPSRQCHGTTCQQETRHVADDDRRPLERW
jgi:hypothetical protein